MIEIGIKNQLFSVESDFTGMRRSEAAKALGSLFGTFPKNIGEEKSVWKVVDDVGKEWIFKDAPGISAQNGKMHTRDGEYRLQLVTPVLSYSDLPKLCKCMSAMRKAGIFVNSSCNMRIKIDSANHNRQSLKNLLGMMYSKEDMIFRALDISEKQAEEWCKKVRVPMLERARKLSADETRDLTRLEAIWFDRPAPKETIYYALDLNAVFTNGMIKFRCFHSTVNTKRLTAYIQFCLAMSAQAILQRNTVMQRTHSENEKYTFRVWLVRLGLNGEEFKETREVMLANLHGEPSWRYGKEHYTDSIKKKTKTQVR